MPDEKTPEQWRAWRDNPVTKALIAEMEADALWFDEQAARARNRAIAHLDGSPGGAGLEGEQRIMAEARTQAGAVRRWLNVLKARVAAAGVPHPDDGRRVTVQG